MSAAAMKEWRKRRGLSQARLGALLGIDERTYRAWEDHVEVTKLARLALYALSVGVQDYDGINVAGEPLVFFGKREESDDSVGTRENPQDQS